MRGDDEICGSFFSYIDLEDRVRPDHPLRPIREIANVALAALPREFASLYSGVGRPSVPPEKLLRAMLLQAFYSVRLERQLMERIEFDLLFRWFVGIGIDDSVWDHSSLPFRSVKSSKYLSGLEKALRKSASTERQPNFFGSILIQTQEN